MAKHIVQTLDDVKSAVADLERQLAEKKRMANWLSDMAGGEPIYEIPDIADERSRWPTRGDEFVAGRATTAFRKAIEMKDAPIDVNELYEMLLAGGYVFDTKSENNAKNSIRVTLSKNSGIFHKLSNGKYGLVKWYGKIKPRKRTTDSEIEDGRDVMEREFGTPTESPQAQES